MTENEPVRHIGCLGEVMIELALQTANTAAVGVAGDTYNTAVYLRRELHAHGSQTPVSYVTALGDDHMSERILQRMQRHGLGSGYVERRRDAAPGLYAIETDPAGERRFSYWRSASAARSLFQTPSDVDVACLHEFDLIYLSGISLAVLAPDVRAAVLDTLSAARQRGTRVAFDSNYRPRLWRSQREAQDAVSAMWATVDMALPSVDDEMALFGDDNEGAVIARLHAAGVTTGALKRGAAGPVDLDPNTDRRVAEDHAEAPGVVDTTAAGDSFNAGWLAAFAVDAPASACLRAGHALARQVVQARGAVVPTEPVLSSVLDAGDP
ncbi:MAG: sugar kinase [Pseudomonadota bacterium]